MRNAWRIGLVAAVVVFAVVLFLFLRADETDDAADVTPAGSPTATQAATGDTDATTGDTGATTGETATGGDETTTDGATADPNTVTAQVRVPRGGPVEVERIAAKAGQRVVLTVRSQIHDEIHIHGYDLLGHTGPGLPAARFSFVADVPGRFDIELEGAHKQIAELTVTP